MNIYFIRHGEPDYSKFNEEDNCGFANFASLTKQGIKQAKELGSLIEKIISNSVIISSPITRALQTAQIMANGRDINIEYDLHEWFPSKTFSIKIKDIKRSNYCYKNNIENEIDYETKEEMINRLENVISKYDKEDNIVIIAHSRLITTYLNHLGIDKKYMNYCEIYKIER